jgi:hypothetical protein
MVRAGGGPLVRRISESCQIPVLKSGFPLLSRAAYGQGRSSWYNCFAIDHNVVAVHYSLNIFGGSTICSARIIAGVQRISILKLPVPPA